MAKLSYGQLKALASSVGMSNPDVMAAIAMAESGGDPKQRNPIPPDNSYGLWQINMLGSMGPARRKSFGIISNSQLYDPVTNAKAAKKILDSQGLKAWSTYTDGKYKKFMDGKSLGDEALDFIGGVAGVGALEGLGDAGGAVIDTGSAIAEGVGVAMDAGEWLSKPSNWVRILYVIGGAVLVIGGVVVMERPLINKAADITPVGKLAKVVT